MIYIHAQRIKHEIVRKIKLDFFIFEIIKLCVLICIKNVVFLVAIVSCFSYSMYDARN